jgi:hypothetical protein
MTKATDEMFGQILRAMIREEVTVALDACGPHGRSDRDDETQGFGRSNSRVSPPPGVDPFALAPFAEHVLRAAGGGPLHVSVIAERMYEQGFRHRRPPKYRDQLVRSVNSLASPSQHPDVFKRVGPRTLELV